MNLKYVLIDNFSLLARRKFAEKLSMWNIKDLNICFYKIFVGNTDRDSVVRHTLKIPIHAEEILIKPKTWQGNIGLRVELYGCSLGKDVWLDCNYDFVVILPSHAAAILD